MRKILCILVLIPIAIMGQTTTENYTKTITYKKPTTVGSPNPNDPLNAIIQIGYFDGLGRPKQKVGYKQAANGNDIITHIEYDALGRQVKEYLPIVNGQTLNYHPINATNVGTYYGTPSIPSIEATGNPYSEMRFEDSPLGKAVEQAAPGNDWSMTNSLKHTVRFDYLTNAATEVKLFSANANWNGGSGLYDISLSLTGTTNYAAGQFLKTITKNENWVTADLKNNTTEEFKDKEGKVILKRTYDNSIAHDTYYIYDQFGNLTYVVPPKADTAITQTVLDELCYQYKYDYKNRLVEKKLPGKQWDFIVYDKLDRVIATGPTFSPFTDFAAPNNIGWMLTKYDYMNRPVLTGWMPSATVSSLDRYNLQVLYNNPTLPVNESKSSTNQINGANSFNTRYTNVAIPNTYETTYHVLTVNYYDDYNTNITFTPAISFTIPNMTPQPIYYNNTNLPKGMPTISWVRIPEASNVFNAEKNYILYDIKGKTVRSFSNNYLGGFTQTDSQLETITGRVNYTITTHKRLASDNVLTVREDFTYSAQDRLLTHMHTINNGTPQLIADNTYDELGQLITKKVGNTNTTGVALQKIDYRYNIRGWLLGINDIYDLKIGSENDMFAFAINYNSPITNNDNGNIKSLYNGNIAETSWRTASDDILRRYGYQYDNLNRLKKSVYQKPLSAVPVQNSYNESATYDKNGNIMTMQRNGDYDDAINTLNIDDLTYFYDQSNTTNRLMKVTDTTNSTIGFDDDSTGYNDTVDDFSYDANGNMTKDENKGITSIKYNHLNLPIEINFTPSPRKIIYLYNALGKKVKKMVTSNGSSYTTTDYIDGYQYEKVGTAAVKLLFFPHAAGYVNNTVSGGVNNYSYVFHYTDHLGNIRASYIFDINNSTATNLLITEENQYYPFGLKHTKYNIDQYSLICEGPGCVVKMPRLPYQYKFQGQERQDELGLNWDSFKYRNYDYAIGRFMSIDPLAEKYSYQSPYNFAENRVIDCRELEGLEGIQINVLATVLKAKLKATFNNTLNSTLGNNSTPSLSGERSNISIKGYNVAKVNEAAIIGESGQKKMVEAGKKAVTETGDVLEKTGDTVVIIAPAFGPATPVVAEAGEIISKTGTVLKASVDVVNEDYDKALEKVGTEALTGAAGNAIVKSTGADEVIVNSAVTATKTGLE